LQRAFSAKTPERASDGSPARRATDARTDSPSKQAGVTRLTRSSSITAPPASREVAIVAGPQLATTGFAYKQGRKRWKKRWLVLEQSRLFYFRKQLDAEAQGFVSMRLALAVEVADQRKNAFRIRDAHGDYVFSTETQLEMHQWLGDLTEAQEKADLSDARVDHKYLNDGMLYIAEDSKGLKLRPRVATIKGGSLVYKESATASKKLGKVALGRSSLGTRAGGSAVEGVPMSLFLFEVRPAKGGPLLLGVESDAERVRWIQCLEHTRKIMAACVGHRPP
jgi:hypothetical protein